MKIKRYLTLLFIVILYFNSKSQLKEDFGFSIGGGANYYSVKNESLNMFFDSYNDKFSSNLKKPLSYLSPKYGYNINAEFLIATIFRFGVTRHFISAESIAEFKNGEQRIIRLNMPSTDWYIDMMSPKEKKIKFGVTITTNYQNHTLFNSYKFANGYESHIGGNDAPDLSGIYRGKGDFTIALGIRSEIKLAKRIFITLKGEYLGLGKVSSLLAHRDELNAGVLSGNIFADGQLPFYLPNDVANAGNIYYTTIAKGNIYGPYKGWRIQAMLNIILFKKSVKS